MDTTSSISLLISHARQGQAEALGRLLQIYANYLRLLAVTHLDGKLQRRVSPSDLVQETHCEAHRDFPHFRGHTEREFVAWLRRILINNIARLVEQHVLAEKRDVRREVSLHELRRSVERSAVRLEGLLAGADATPSTCAQQRERAVVLADQMAELPDDYRQVIMLRNFEGLPFKQVAQCMNRSPGAARMLWLRAINELRRMLVEKEMV